MTPAEKLRQLISKGDVSRFPGGDGSNQSGAETNSKSASEAPGALKVTRISSVTAKPIKPLLPGWLYLGKVTVVAGIPGDGKSLLTIDLASRISSGGKHPVGNGQFEKAPVLLLTAEDDPADTIRPRLDVAGADTDLVEMIEGVHRVDEATKERSLDLVSLTNDLPAIEQHIIKINPHLWIIDPLTSFADSDTNKTADMRRLLDGLAQLAGRTGIAVLVVTHLNKRSDAKKAMQMIAGSHIIVAAVRVVLVTARDPEDRGRRLVLPIKCNIGPDGAGFGYHVDIKQHAICGDVPVVEWEPEQVKDMSADDVLIDATPRSQAAVMKTTEVCDWLKDLLKGGPVSASTVWTKAEELEYSKRRVRSALKILKCAGEPLGYQGTWHYRLPLGDAEVT